VPAAQPGGPAQILGMNDLEETFIVQLLDPGQNETAARVFGVTQDINRSQAP